MLDLRLYMLQRLTALVMAPLVIGHIAVMIYAVQGGLTVDEILARTQGSVAWFLFYGSFVVAVSIHGAIGLRVISFEWFGLKGRALQLFSWAVFALLFGLGAKAVYAVTFAGAGLLSGRIARIHYGLPFCFTVYRGLVWRCFCHSIFICCHWPFQHRRCVTGFCVLPI